MSLLNIDIAINAADWPSEAKLRALSVLAIETASKAAKLKWPADAELSLVFTNDAEMQEINLKWRDQDKSTNVLSFPGEDISVGEPAGLMIGDIILAFETIAQESKVQGKKFDDHLTHLIIHGFLHLFGYDHLDEDQAEDMESLEIKTLAALEIANPYQNID